MTKVADELPPYGLSDGCALASVHANMEDNPPHVFISRDMPQPVEKVVYRDVRHADVLALAT